MDGGGPVNPWLRPVAVAVGTSGAWSSSDRLRRLACHKKQKRTGKREGAPPSYSV